MRRCLRRIGGALVAAAVVVGCSGGGATSLPTASVSSSSNTSAAAAPSGALTVYAAASLTASFKDLAAAYQRATGAGITLSFDSSATLEAQIEQGAPADILAAADTATPAKLVTAGVAAGAPVPFAGNVLTIIVPSGSTAVTAPADLAKPGVKIIAAGDAVPITKYANQLIDNLAGAPGAPPRFADAVKANIVSKEENVKGVVSKIEVGEGDAGIVYVTDAKASAKVKTVEVPPALNVRAVYAAVAVKGSRNVAAASAFLAWLTGADAQAILAKYGFTPPG